MSDDKPNRFRPNGLTLVGRDPKLKPLPRGRDAFVQPDGNLPPLPRDPGHRPQASTPSAATEPDPSKKD